MKKFPQRWVSPPGSRGRLLELNGNFYGTTSRGGSTLGGTIFGVTRSGTVATLLSFDPSTQGSFPTGGLVQDERETSS